jgi:hypothetical protein
LKNESFSLCIEGVVLLIPALHIVWRPRILLVHMGTGNAADVSFHGGVALMLSWHNPA